MLTAHQLRLEQKYEDFVAELRTTPPIDCEFSVGDNVTFTNEYGVVFEGHKVIGFAEDDSFYGRFIHIDTDSYWFPHTPEELTKGTPDNVERTKDD